MLLCHRATIARVRRLTAVLDWTVGEQWCPPNYQRQGAYIMPLDYAGSTKDLHCTTFAAVYAKLLEMSFALASNSMACSSFNDHISFASTSHAVSIEGAWHIKAAKSCCDTDESACAGHVY